jgi:hypothetical protein
MVGALEGNGLNGDQVGADPLGKRLLLLYFMANR